MFYASQINMWPTPLVANILKHDDGHDGDDDDGDDDDNDGGGEDGGDDGDVGASDDDNMCFGLCRTTYGHQACANVHSTKMMMLSG